ncbi:DNA polymerase IV [Clostridium tyrobutyricum]|uniref:DNA polymerase IV n=1 Tax=Clostridium tyrobutyricum TaxID=1519 RepID=UPI001C38CB5A|nr:DNA polymerase IV [Clostridium tyrobutyricum]MBV4424554.1 DNA polymerase IV [Clostridium tyrobutyricum]
MKRVIFLVDMDAFFTSCESIRHPEILKNPAVVAGDPKKRSGIILTANYEARKFGIKTTMLLNKALKLCPDLIIIEPDRNFYKQKSKEVIDILSSYTPLIEQNSIDEAWLDMTGCEKIFGSPEESAKLIAMRIKNELGLSCSIGISENKFLSKMASEIKKPSGITELWKKDIKTKLWPKSINYMYGVGKHTAEKLKNIEIENIGELALFNKNILIKELGKMGAELHALANGIDDSPVKPHSRDDIKSIGKSITLSKDIFDIEYAKIVLMKLCDTVGMTARKYNKNGRIVQLSIKYYNFHVITRRTTIPATCLVKDIYSASIKLFKNNWNSNTPIRLLGISLSGFSENSFAKQISIFELTKIKYDIEISNKSDKIEDVISNIRNKYGFSIINRAVLMNRNLRNKP